MTNHFTNVINDVQQCPASQRPDHAIEGIAQQMLASGDPQTRKLGQELEDCKPQLVKALQRGE